MLISTPPPPIAGGYRPSPGGYRPGLIIHVIVNSLCRRVGRECWGCPRSIHPPLSLSFSIFLLLSPTLFPFLSPTLIDSDSVWRAGRACWGCPQRTSRQWRGMTPRCSSRFARGKSVLIFLIDRRNHLNLLA